MKAGIPLFKGVLAFFALLCCQSQVTTLERIRIRPEAYITKLIGDPSFKLRIDNYRVIMDINNNNLLILVIKVGHRKDIFALNPSSSI